MPSSKRHSYWMECVGGPLDGFVVEQGSLLQQFICDASGKTYSVGDTVPRDLVLYTYHYTRGTITKNGYHRYVLVSAQSARGKSK